jgi:hypothetical protein
MSRASTLLLVNGGVLGGVAALQFVLDFTGYFTGIGPMGRALHGNLDAIGYAEAHGLALGFAILMIICRNDGWRGWNLVAGLVHLLLGTCNVIFWPVFESAGVVPLGIAATAMHAIFAVLEIRAYSRSSTRATAAA